jgi:hypothetical protein
MARPATGQVIVDRRWASPTYRAFAVKRLDEITVEDVDRYRLAKCAGES